MVSLQRRPRLFAEYRTRCARACWSSGAELVCADSGCPIWWDVKGSWGIVREEDVIFSASSRVRRWTMRCVKGLCDRKIFVFAVYGVCMLDNLMARAGERELVLYMCSASCKWARWVLNCCCGFRADLWRLNGGPGFCFLLIIHICQVPKKCLKFPGFRKKFVRANAEAYKTAGGAVKTRETITIVCAHNDFFCENFMALQIYNNSQDFSWTNF